MIYNATIAEDQEKLWDNKQVQEALRRRGKHIINALDVIDAVLLPGEKEVTLTALETERLNSLLEKGYRLSVGIEDPMTEFPCVRFAMEALYQEGKNYLW